MIYLSVIIAVIGLLMYALASNPKVARIGEIAFAAGLFAFLLTFGGNIFLGK